mmetsp:Transcript_37082/g.82482  ORF Transcript_37082/g.82482 Transcript_37082/m.82482 type:complete len:292 (-) Transcript_37082:265-1140(-)|eukprot:CAMPEP_0202898892 /NCGR_PEP_ID=MMETSP1392-20130828/7293_1 /ASSEMBLY_ACC=CAM_ASM_000868 /TAXON_ID=225041 /ORGANISM="Chlamydomonas chlamydogama, Strain SAG 11-48b" /LENGTH=291 /DNA_ID=CAMNT_0049584949 /DNA_START=26 /DNA_END=901 /DNA_ORIENTATION=-
MLGSDLPQEVAHVLPVDTSGQIDIAFKIIHYAFAQKVAVIEAESQQLREAVISKQNTIKTLERRVSNLELESQELQLKNKQAVEEQHKLQTEKSALIDTVKKLNREVQKLHEFKKSLIQHLHDDDEPAKLERSFATMDISSERLVNDVLNSASKGPTVVHASSTYAARGAAAAPSIAQPSTSGRQLGSQAHGYGGSSPPIATTFTTSPQASLSSSPQLASQVDGKEFFRHARQRLSYEQFSQFLHLIKELNAGRITRDETLRRAYDILGHTHQDLYGAFEQLLSRAMTSFT